MPVEPHYIFCFVLSMIDEQVENKCGGKIPWCCAYTSLSFSHVTHHPAPTPEFVSPHLFPPYSIVKTWVQYLKHLKNYLKHAKKGVLDEWMHNCCSYCAQVCELKLYREPMIMHMLTNVRCSGSNLLFHTCQQAWGIYLWNMKIKFMVVTSVCLFPTRAIWHFSHKHLLHMPLNCILSFIKFCDPSWLYFICASD